MVIMGVLCGSAGKESVCNVGDLGLIPGLGSPGDPLEKGMATHSSILAWRIHGLYSPWGHKELETIEPLSLHFMGIIKYCYISYIVQHVLVTCLFCT